MARDVTKRAHVRPGLQVKLVPEGTPPGVQRIAEGRVAQVLSGDDPRGVVVRLEDGTVGNVLRIWEGGDARKDAPPVEGRREDEQLPSYNLERPGPAAHKQFLLGDREVEKLARESLGKRPADLGKLITKAEEGLAAGAMRRFGIDDDELAALTRETLGALREDDLGRALARGPEQDRADDDGDAPEGKRDRR